MTVNEKAKAAMEKAQTARKAATPADVMCMSLSRPETLQSIENALPQTIKANAKRFSRILMTLARQTRGLAECDLPSVLGGALTGAALGLDPTPGLDEFYLVPFRDGRTGKKAAQFILGYKGMMRLAYQGGCRKIIAREVCRNDIFEITYGYEERLVHKPPVTGERGEEIGYYVIVTLPDGEKTFCYMSKDDAVKHAREKSKAYSSGPWVTDLAAMAQKTCLRKIFKWLPKSTEAALALSKDEGVVSVAADEVRSAEAVLEAPVSHVVVDVPESDDKGANGLTNANVSPAADERLDALLGAEGLDLRADEREGFIARALGAEGLTAGWRTEENIKKVIAAAERALAERDGL